MLTRLAPAKINLTLHVTGQRPDGYHALDSLVVFAEVGDRLTLAAGEGLTLALTGPYAAGLAGESDNLVLRAARAAGAQSAAFTLEKQLPLASGMGGGSSDAAAALHLLSEGQGLALPGDAALMRLGADVPVCMAAPHPMRMRGLGEVLGPVRRVPALWLLLVNPGQGLSTPAVFRALARRDNPPMPERLPGWQDAADLCAWLATQRNDLEPPSRALMPVIAQVLDRISGQSGCLLARMTGSGATCFGVFADQPALTAAAQALAQPGHFIAATRSAPSVN